MFVTWVKKYNYFHQINMLHCKTPEDNVYFLFSKKSTKCYKNSYAFDNYQTPDPYYVLKQNSFLPFMICSFNTIKTFKGINY